MKVAVFVFAFGVVPEGFKNNPNSAIIDYAIKKFGENLSAFFCVQTDTNSFQFPQDRVFCIEDKGDKTPPTWNLAKDFVKKAIEVGAKEIVVVCAKPHRFRAKEDVLNALEKFGFSGFLHVSVECPTRGYSSKSLQSRTRSPFKWWLREVPLLFLAFCIPSVYHWLSDRKWNVAD